jgi:hypothetical protein
MLANPSALRVDDGVYRMTRERAVVLLADVAGTRAPEVVDRVLGDFRERFPTSVSPAIAVGFYEVAPEEDDLTAKHVLPQIFATPPPSH